MEHAPLCPLFEILCAEGPMPADRRTKPSSFDDRVKSDRVDEREPSPLHCSGRAGPPVPARPAPAPPKSVSAGGTLLRGKKGHGTARVHRVNLPVLCIAHRSREPPNTRGGPCQSANFSEAGTKRPPPDESRPLSALPTRSQKPWCDSTCRGHAPIAHSAGVRVREVVAARSLKTSVEMGAKTIANQTIAPDHGGRL